MRRYHRKERIFEFWTYVLFSFFVVSLVMLVVQLFIIQIKNHEEYLALAKKQFDWYSIIEPKRGEVFIEDKDGNRAVLATNQELYTLYINPMELADPAETLTALKTIIDFKNNDLSFLEKMKDKERSYLILEKDISRSNKEKIETLRLKGVYFKQYYKRVYPLEALAATTIGFVGSNDDGIFEGKYGIENFYEDILAGKPGFLTSQNETLRLPEDGANIVLTLDPKIQQEAERILSQGVEKNKAEGGTVIVMRPKTGEILALADLPGFNPNTYSLYSDFSLFRNKAVENYEPGSVTKAITIAAALNENKLTPETIYDDKGFVKADGYTIRNYDEKGHGTITIRHGMEKSYNTVAMHALSLLGDSAFVAYLRDFGFGEKTGIELPTEDNGDISNLLSKDSRDVNFLTASFGQGINVTPLQLIRAFSAFANNGVMVRPRLVKQIEFTEGKIKRFFPEEIKTLLKSYALEELNSILISVVENGSGQPTRMKKYILAGKTGTAQIPKVGSPGYEPDDFIQTFIGFGPVSNPQFIILVRMVRPGLIGLRFAETTVVPIFRDISNFIINYYNIPPDRPSQE